MRLISGDCIEAMRELPDQSVDAIVTDPPYGLGFMGKAWDDLPPGEEWGRECLRVLKPGGHLLAFGGSRTYHRLACAVEDAGFEVRDQMMWLYGSGFPKSLDVSKAIDRRRDDREQVLQVTTALADAAESAFVSRSDIDAHMGTSDMAGWWTSRLLHRCQCPTWDQWVKLREFVSLDSPETDALVWRLNGRKGQLGEAWSRREVVGRGKSAIANKDEGPRHTVGASKAVEFDLTAPATPEAEAWSGWGTALKPAHEPIVVARKPLAGTVAENVLKHGTGAINVDGCRIALNGEQWGGNKDNAHEEYTGKVYGAFGEQYAKPSNPAGRWPANVVLDEEAGRLLDEQSGTLTSGANPTRRGADDERQVLGAFNGQAECDAPRGADTGGASRFFYCAKASKGERNAGLDGFEQQQQDEARKPGNPGGDNPRNRGVRQRANYHPTVKPISLMRYLVRLVTPPEGTVLDPFLGSGTTGCAAVLEGFDFIGIEREAEYLAIAEARIAWWDKHRGEGETDEILKAAGVRDEIESSGQLGLLEEAA